MNARNYDIVVVTDPRFQGGTSSAVASEIRAASRAGYRIGFVAFEAGNLRQPFPFNPRLKRLLDQGQIDLIAPGEPSECKLAILHNPYTAGLIPVRPLGITAEYRLVVAHHPPVDALGRPAYDVPLVERNAEAILAGPADWAPVGPNVRRSFRSAASSPRMLPEDWSNSIDLDVWYRVPQARSGSAIRIGRHSRADMRKFPRTRDEFLTIYGEDPDTVVDLLGCPSEIATILSPVPPNWRLRPFGSTPVPDFLDQLDAFVYFHRDDWVEAFGYAVLEAMARGIPCVLPESLRPSFGEAAQIVRPEDALPTALELAEAPDDAREAGYQLIREHHSLDSVTRRLSDLIGPPERPSVKAATRRRTDTTVLLLSTNGVGMGHLTRTIAIARRLPSHIRPILVTMSHGADVANEFGYHVEFIPYHRYLGVNQEYWNFALRDEIIALIDAFDSRAVLFDGNSPFNGLIDAFGARPYVWSIWCRRGMWQPDAGQQFIAREASFDAVIHPLDIAEEFDTGLATSNGALTRPVGPIRLLDRQEILERSRARKELGIREEGIAILVQLGSGNNFETRLSLDLLFRRLGGRKDVQLALVDWKISTNSLPSDMPDNVLRLSTYPVSRYLNGFDATVSAAGYNSFHEATDATLPAIYIPNENPSQDNQLARAEFAARYGAAIVARQNSPEALVAALSAILDPERRAAMSRAAKAISRDNGAKQAAEILHHLAMTNRGIRDRVPLLSNVW